MTTHRKANEQKAGPKLALRICQTAQEPKAVTSALGSEAGVQGHPQAVLGQPEICKTLLLNKQNKQEEEEEEEEVEEDGSAGEAVGLQT